MKFCMKLVLLTVVVLAWQLLRGFVQALAEKESDGMAKMIYRKDTGEILGVHIFGLHAADLIHEASNAMATHQRVQVITLNASLPDCCTQCK